MTGPVQPDSTRSGEEVKFRTLTEACLFLAEDRKATLTKEKSFLHNTQGNFSLAVLDRYRSSPRRRRFRNLALVMTHLSPDCVFASETGMLLYHLDCRDSSLIVFGAKSGAVVSCWAMQAHQSTPSVLLYPCDLSLPAHSLRCYRDATAALIVPIFLILCLK